MRLKFFLSFIPALSLYGAGAMAETLPLPRADYEMTAKVFGGGSLSSRHAGGKIRTEVQAPGMPGPMVAIIDLKAKKMVGLMSLPGQPPMAIDIDIDDNPSMGFAVGEGERTGKATVAGESCDLWKIKPSSAEDKNFNGVICITSDGIPLSMEGTVEGKRERFFEATSLKRGAQDPQLFVLPANVQRMPVPGMKGKK